MRGWLFDLYPGAGGMVLWLLLEPCGTPVRLLAPYRPAFYVDGPPPALARVRQALAGSGLLAGAGPVERVDLLAGRTRTLLRLVVADPLRYAAAVQRVARLDPRLDLFTCDLPVAQLYLYETGLFPLARCEVDADARGVVRAIGVLDDDPEALDYPLPPLRTLTLAFEEEGDPDEGPAVDPRHGRRRAIRVEVDGAGRSLVLEPQDPDGLLREVHALLVRHDPDVLLTDWGDSVLLPELAAAARRRRAPLALNREARPPVEPARPWTYFSYGRLHHREPIRPLYGRWHLDRRNSFLLEATGLDGLIEFARLCRLPVQRAARTTIGTGLASMQFALAVREGILVPWHKGAPEAFKRADQLLAADRGGLVYLPEPGVYEQVGELDFSALYPHIMARYNLSPETMHCACCPDGTPVPGLGMRVCVRRRGLVARSIEPILRKRAAYKRLRRTAPTAEARSRYERRQSVLKWIGVTTFGYLGHHNARFGRIEAHEATNAFGRELLLAAKEAAEQRGFRFVHALVDALWVTKPGAAMAEYEALAEAVSRQTGFEMAVEGLYDWLLFVPSRQARRLGVANRYAGRLADGRIKVRGLELRRRDTPRLVARMQAELLHVLARARDAAGLRDALPAAVEVVRAACQRLRDGRATFAELALTRRLARDPFAYERAGHTAIVAHELLARGVRLAPGEAVAYVVTDAAHPDPAARVRAYAALDGASAYDRAWYERAVLRAAESVLGVLGYDAARLAAEVGGTGAGGTGGEAGGGTRLRPGSRRLRPDRNASEPAPGGTAR